MSNAPFRLDERLARDTLAVGESELSLLRLMNDRRYPWLVLVPKRLNVAEIFELDDRDRATLLEESTVLARALAERYAPCKMNVAMLGNVVRPLHVHVVVRTPEDPAWPGPVWGHSPAEPYAPDEAEARLHELAGTAIASRFDFP